MQRARDARAAPTPYTSSSSIFLSSPSPPCAEFRIDSRLESNQIEKFKESKCTTTSPRLGPRLLLRLLCSFSFHFFCLRLRLPPPPLFACYFSCGASYSRLASFLCVSPVSVPVSASCIDRIAALDSNQRPDASRFYSIVLPTFSFFLFPFCFPPLPHIGVPSLPPPTHPSSVCFAPFLSRRVIGQRTNDSRLIYRPAPHPLHFVFLFLLARCFVVRPPIDSFMHVCVIACTEGGRVLANRHTCRPVVLRDAVIRSSPFPPFPIPLPVTFISIHALVPFPLPLSLPYPLHTHSSFISISSCTPFSPPHTPSTPTIELTSSQHHIYPFTPFFFFSCSLSPHLPCLHPALCTKARAGQFVNTWNAMRIGYSSVMCVS